MGTGVLLLVLAAAVTAAAAAWLWWRRRQERRRLEGFLPLLFGAAGLGITAAGFLGADKKAQNALFKKGEAKPAITYVGRAWDGADWSCPAGTVDTGNGDNTKACINSQYHPPVWRWNGKEWSHSCQNGTVDTGEAMWEKKCEVGYTGRYYDEGQKRWQCYEGTDDTGANWDKGWREGQKQCKRRRAYTVRINKGGKWVCPDFSKDTGRSWGKPNEWDQCKWGP